jgi:predicted ATPase
MQSASLDIKYVIYAELLMYLASLVVRNFRSLEDIEVAFDHRVNVIVGPNAIGKTTLLEAIRLAKALLAPRTQNEANQVLFSLGAATPYNPQNIIGEAIAGDVTKAIFIRCTFTLSSSELDTLQKSLPAMAANVMFEGMGRGFANAADMIAALSTPDGMKALEVAQQELAAVLSEIRAGTRECRLELTIDPASGLSSGDRFGAAFIAFLDRRLPPNLAIFSYFPADRAIPTQEQPIQIGIADAANQLESHNSQPQLKYQRLKNTIFNTVVANQDGHKQLDEDFQHIFDRILKGRRLVGVGVNQHGLLSISVEDVESGKRFGIDAMSSGEKGLILTFLLIARTVSEGGIVILDEPELHLNPAVCKDLLSCLAEEYAITRNLQLLVCSHSPEILSGAFERDDCALYHLRTGKLLTLVRRQDQDEVSEALRRLGTSESEALLYKATVFVEGEHDSELLEAGFEKLFRRYKFKDLGGRREVEKEIKSLQEAEAKGNSVSAQFFIFDRDEAPTGLVSSQNVRVLQWSRRCLENYLIDIDVLTDLLKDDEHTDKPVKNVGELQNLLKELAMSQIADLVAKEVYDKYSFENAGLRPYEIQGKSFPETASLLFQRLSRIREQMVALDQATWEREFVRECENGQIRVAEIWEAKWRDNCDGKKLFTDLQRRLGIRMRLPRFKKRVILEMKNRSTENWRTMESLLKELLHRTP